jgi:GNAT superfamily N-acetyltransferase
MRYVPSETPSESPVIDLQVLTADDDLHAIGSLAEQIWSEHYPGIISWAQIHYMLERTYAPKLIASEIASGVRWLCAVDDLGPCAFAAYGVQADGRVRLDKLYVLRSHRGQGIARRLLDELIDWCAGADVEKPVQRIYLTVNKHNSSSIEAYGRMGFALEGSQVTDIGHGFVMDDYVMGRPLSQA